MCIQFTRYLSQTPSLVSRRNLELAASWGRSPICNQTLQVSSELIFAPLERSRREKDEDFDDFYFFLFGQNVDFSLQQASSKITEFSIEKHCLAGLPGSMRAARIASLQPRRRRQPRRRQPWRRPMRFRLCRLQRALDPPRPSSMRPQPQWPQHARSRRKRRLLWSRPHVRAKRRRSLVAPTSRPSSSV